ncbi:hypothetical protein RIF29_00606 [Crotalaria pallida]|uniref:Uncharacterized protein n=1 Tax=Crotalaria pallida TaxID=3830 RepID=A0AAN9IVR1_CROPI
MLLIQGIKVPGGAIHEGFQQLANAIKVILEFIFELMIEAMNLLFSAVFDLLKDSITGLVRSGNRNLEQLQGCHGLCDRECLSASEICSESTGKELLENELPLKFIEVDEEQSRLVLSNNKAIADS